MGARSPRLGMFRSESAHEVITQVTHEVPPGVASAGWKRWTDAAMLFDLLLEIGDYLGQSAVELRDR